MTEVLITELELARNLVILKRELYACPDYTVMASFKSVDRQNTGVITSVNLGEFFRIHNHFASETELLAVIRRLDLDGDAAVNYSEW